MAKVALPICVVTKVEAKTITSPIGTATAKVATAALVEQRRDLTLSIGLSSEIRRVFADASGSSFPLAPRHGQGFAVGTAAGTAVSAGGSTAPCPEIRT